MDLTLLAAYVSGQPLVQCLYDDLPDRKTAHGGTRLQAAPQVIGDISYGFRSHTYHHMMTLHPCQHLIQND